jgi:hypothetical protein
MLCAPRPQLLCYRVWNELVDVRSWNARGSQAAWSFTNSPSALLKLAEHCYTSGNEKIEGRKWYGATFTILRSFEFHLDDDIPPQKITFLQLLKRKNKAGHSYCCLLLVPTDNSKRKYKRVRIGNAVYVYDAVSDKDKFHFFHDFKTETVILA